MPRLISYPRASLDKSLELASMVHNEGSMTYDDISERLGRQRGVRIKDLIGAAVKYNLVAHANHSVVVTKLLNDILGANTQLEHDSALKKAFLSPPLFRELFTEQVFDPAELTVRNLLPIILGKNVDEPSAESVAHYYIEGARRVGLYGLEDSVVKVTEPIVQEVKEVPEIETTEMDTKTDSAQIAQHVRERPTQRLSPEDNEPIRMTIPLSGRRTAELVVPSGFTSQDLSLIKKIMEAIEPAAENKKPNQVAA